ncbi:hypothetical protein [Desulfobulbus alkaliphilus]|uniref:hypothetical protein n=1 Tax=Desulfobulbus alkaliphilus TaxID=869814 RepID=UPI001962CBF6|nr:hypothetical protein [Desulfobulbus alkaliphilus]MBM9535826.1 hypothetical protein [Desulfobulbus alkaliphilus]
MTVSFLLVSGCILAWMLSPEALIILGNSIGVAGAGFFLSLGGGLVVSSLAAALLHKPNLNSYPDSPTFGKLADAIGVVPAMAMLLASRLCLVLFLPTGMLVTAGFAFNETVWYRFPAFAFSAVLLACILVLHLISRRIAVMVQVFFVGVTVVCLLVLIAAGLPALLPGLSTLSLPVLSVIFSPTGLFIALLLFLGYDQTRPVEEAKQGAAGVVGALMIGGAVYALWAAVSLGHVPGETLAASTLPHVLVAREILGHSGSMIMTIAVISGTCGVVNGLFLLANTSLRHMSVAFSPRPLSANQERVFSVLYSASIGLALAAGLAGSSQLETFIHGSLLLWLLTVAMLCYAAARRLRKLKRSPLPLGYSLCALYLAAVLWLATTVDEPGVLIMFCLVALSIAALLSSLWLLVTGRRLNPRLLYDQGEIQ